MVLLVGPYTNSMQILWLSYLEFYQTYGYLFPHLALYHHCLSDSASNPSPHTNYSSLSLCLLSSPSTLSSWLAQQNLPTLDFLIRLLFAHWGPPVSPISEPTQISFRGGEPEDQVPLGALMCLHLLSSSGHCETESYPTPCFPFDLYVNWEDKDCFVLSTLYLLSVQYSRNLNRWMDRSIDLCPGLLQVRLILMWKGKWSDMQNTSVNSVSSEKGSAIGMTMGWALVWYKLSWWLEGSVSLWPGHCTQERTGGGSCAGREVGPWRSCVADGELRVSIAEELHPF